MALIYSLARRKLSLACNILLIVQISVQVAKIQLFKRKRLTLTQEVTQAEPLLIVSFSRYNDVAGFGLTFVCCYEDDSLVFFRRVKSCI
jgi:hypothetical protein